MKTSTLVLLRFNTDIGVLEYYDGTTWVQPGKLTTVLLLPISTLLLANVYFVDTTGGQRENLLSASPNIGDEITFFDVAKTFDSNNLVVNRNGRPIRVTPSNLTVSTEGAAFSLVYSGSTYGWRIFSI